MEISDRLKQLIELKHVTRYEISKATNISEGALSRLVNNKRAKPNIENMKKLANYFNTTIDWLKTGTGEMFNTSDIPPEKPYIPPEPLRIPKVEELTIEAYNVYKDMGIMQMQKMVNDMKQQVMELLITVKEQSSSINNMSFAEKQRSIEATLKQEHINSLGRSIENLSVNVVHKSKKV